MTDTSTTDIPNNKPARSLIGLASDEISVVNETIDRNKKTIATVKSEVTTRRAEDPMPDEGYFKGNIFVLPKQPDTSTLDAKISEICKNAGSSLEKNNKERYIRGGSKGHNQWYREAISRYVALGIELKVIDSQSAALQDPTSDETKTLTELSGRDPTTEEISTAVEKIKNNVLAKRANLLKALKQTTIGAQYNCDDEFNEIPKYRAKDEEIGKWIWASISNRTNEITGDTFSLVEPCGTEANSVDSPTGFLNFLVKDKFVLSDPNEYLHERVSPEKEEMAIKSAVEDIKLCLDTVCNAFSMPENDKVATDVIENGIRESQERMQKLLAAKQRWMNEQKTSQQAKQATRQQALAAKEEKLREAEEQKREAALKQAEQARAAAIEFNSKFQPYVLLSEVYSDLHKLESLSNSSAHNARHASLLFNTVTEGTKLLDIRDPSVKSLGDLMFGKAAIAGLTSALGLAGVIGKNQYSSAGTIEKHARELSSTYKTSNAARNAVDGMLADPHLIMIVAEQTRSTQRIKSYADALLQNEKNIAAYTKQIEDKKQTLGMTDEELRLLADEPEVKALHALQEKIDDSKKTIDADRIALASEIGQIIDGKSHKKTAEGKTTLPDAVSLMASALSPKQQTALGSDFSEMPASAEKFVRITSTVYPHIFAEIKKSELNDKFEKSLKILRERIGQHSTNLVLQEKLVQTYGFYANGNDLIQPEFTISTTLDADEGKQTGQLVMLEQRALARMAEQESMIESLKKSGFTLDERSPPIRLTHQQMGIAAFAARGFFTESDYLYAGSLLQKLQPADVQDKQADEVSPATPTTQHQAEKWQISPKQTILIPDTNLLRNLSAKRNHSDRTWLDLLKQTARLPNVVVVVPSTVADWECTGRIPDGTTPLEKRTFKTIDPRFARQGEFLNIAGSSIEHFFQSASRGRLNDDGSVDIVYGTNRNIIIMETPGDRQLYERLDAIANKTEAERLDYLASSVHGFGEGEKAITRIINGLDMPNRMAIMTDDLKYLKESAPRSSRNGAPVNHVGGMTYLQSEVDSRGDELRQKLGVQEPLTLRHVSRSIVDFWNTVDAKGYPFMSKMDDTGHSNLPNSQPSLKFHSIINGTAEKHTPHPRVAHTPAALTVAK